MKNNSHKVINYEVNTVTTGHCKTNTSSYISFVNKAAKRLWQPSRWNTKAAKSTGNKEDVKTLYTYLEIVRTKVYNAKRILPDTNKQIERVIDMFKTVCDIEYSRLRSALNMIVNTYAALCACGALDRTPSVFR